MKKLTDVIDFYMMKEYQMDNLKISGTSLMMKLHLTYDDLYDFASESLYPLDAFTIECSPAAAKMLKTKLIIDESMWFKESSEEEPIHEQNGLKIIYDDSKVVLCSSGLTLQDEGYTFKDLYELMLKLSQEEKIILTIPYIIEDFYKIIFDQGKVIKDEVDLSKISMKEAKLGLFQVIMLAGKEKISDILKLID